MLMLVLGVEVVDVVDVVVVGGGGGAVVVVDVAFVDPRGLAL